jgi:Mn2+/Fe2+ NRAMP family transporter
LNGSLATKVRYRPAFYGVIAAATIAGVLMNLLHVDPIRALFLSAVLNGAVAPPLLALIVLLGSDGGFMQDKVSGRWSKGLTWIATGVMGIAAMAMLVTMVVP